LLAVLAGLRKGEIAALQWENLDFVNGVIEVRYAYSRIDGLKEPKTKAGRRDIPMSRLMRMALERVRDISSDHQTGPVFAAEGTNFYTNTWHQFGFVMQQAGLGDGRGRTKFTFHTLRHAAAALWIEQGIPLLEVAKLMGHSRVSTTLENYPYLFQDNSKARKAMDSISQAFMPTPRLMPSPDATAMRPKPASG
jgi:integrase